MYYEIYNESCKDRYFSKTDEYFEKLRFNSLALNSAITKYGSYNIREFITKFEISKNCSYQESDDLLEIIFDYVKKLLGEETAFETVKTIKDGKMLLTANHHGVDSFAQSVQGSLIFSLICRKKNENNTITPIIACGNISLNNLTYPRGILIYGINKRNFLNIPLKIPILPDRVKTKAVCAVNSIKKDNLKNCKKRIFDLKKESFISKNIYEVLNNVIDEDYSSSFVLQQEKFSDQAVILNYRLWKKILNGNLKNTKIVYLELEEITRRLIAKDLNDPRSLAYITLFDPAVRRKILESLNNKKACWENDILKFKCLRISNQINETNLTKNGGTHFFWGIDKNMKRLSLILEDDGNHDLLLKSIDDNDNLVSIPFKPEILAEKLLNKEIIPSLFLSYLAISFARGIMCIGGYYQSEYLPVMKEKLMEALNGQKSYKNMNKAIRKIETTNYLSGMQTIMIKNDEDSIFPAGLVELIASGGVNDNDIENILTINIEDAHKASILDTLTDLKIDENIDNNWKEIVSKDNYNQLKEKIIIREKV
jgi:hypothetical protein